MDRHGFIEKNQEWQEVKKVVRAVLLSEVKNGIKLGAFVRRYRELYQTYLEPRKFGFNTALELLKAMPDVVRFETSAFGKDAILHAEVQNMDNVYLTPALKRTAQRLKKEMTCDSESECVPRKKVQGTASIFMRPDRRTCGSTSKPNWPESSNFEFGRNPSSTVIQREEMDPLRKEIADEMKPNIKGYYAIMVPRRSMNNVEELEEIFGVYGEIKEVSRTERYCFLRYQYRHQAVSAVLDTRGRFGTRVPEERGNPQRVIMAKDIMNRPSCSRQMAADVSAPLISAGSFKEENLEDVEVFIGNISKNALEADVLKLFANYNIRKKRFVDKDIKRFAFFTVVGMDEATRMCSALHKTVLNGRELVVQVSYVSTNECMPAIDPAIPEGDVQKFTNRGPVGIYKPFTNFDDKDDSDEEEIPPLESNQGHEPLSLFTRPIEAQNYGSAQGHYDSWRPSLTVNLPNAGNLEVPDDLPALEDDWDIGDYGPQRTVVYRPSDDSDIEYDVPLNSGAMEYHVILEGFPHHTHFKDIYKEFRIIGIERLKVDIVNNYKPNPTLAIVTFDNETSIEEALKWNGSDFNYQPMYIRVLDQNNKDDLKMLQKVQEGKRNEEFHGQVQRFGNERNERSLDISSMRGRGAKPYQGYASSRGQVCLRGRGQPKPNGYNHHRGHAMSQGDYSHFPAQRGSHHTGALYPARQFAGRGNMNRPPAPTFINHGPGRGVRPPRFPSANHRLPFQRGFQHPRGRSRGHQNGHNQHSQRHPTRDPYEPTKEDYAVSSQMEQILKDCFPEGCLPWISKDLPEKAEVHVAEIVGNRYFFGHVTNGLPGIEIKELTRKMAEKTFADSALPFTDPKIRRCAALYSESEDQPPELFRAWIKEFHDDGQCEVFFIDWGNIAKDSCDKLSVIRDIHWTMRPQIVLFKIDDTSKLSRGLTCTLRVLTKNVYENNYAVPVECISSE